MMLLIPSVVVTLLSAISTTTAAFHLHPDAIITPFASSNRARTAASPLHASPLPTGRDDHPDPSSTTIDAHPILGRRSLLAAATGTTAALLASVASPLPSLAADAAPTTDFTVYKDKPCAFQIKVPTAWEQSEQTLPDRRRIVFFIDPKSGAEDKNLIFVAYTPIRDDFTSLASFGTVEQIAQMTILPKSSLVGEKTDNTMLTADSKKDAYYFDYVSQVSGQPKRHFRTIFALAPGATGGAGSVLVSITAQTLESNYAGLKPLFDDVVASYEKYKGE